MIYANTVVVGKNWFDIKKTLLTFKVQADLILGMIAMLGFDIFFTLLLTLKKTCLCEFGCGE